MLTKILFLFTILAVVFTMDSNQGINSKVGLAEIFSKGKSMNVSYPHKELEIRGFYSEDCTRGQGKAVVENLTVRQQHTGVPGEIRIRIAGIGRVKEELNGPFLEAHYNISKEFLNRMWIKLPCMVPPCDVYDICEEMQEIGYCPPSMIEEGFDCQCPIPEGIYPLEETLVIQFDGDDFATVTGRYRAMGTLEQHRETLACIRIHFTLAAINVDS